MAAGPNRSHLSSWVTLRRMANAVIRPNQVRVAGPNQAKIRW
jgi:hypothetical protein